MEDIGNKELDPLIRDKYHIALGDYILKKVKPSGVLAQSTCRFQKNELSVSIPKKFEAISSCPKTKPSVRASNPTMTKTRYSTKKGERSPPPKSPTSTPKTKKRIVETTASDDESERTELVEHQVPEVQRDQIVKFFRDFVVEDKTQYISGATRTKIAAITGKSKSSMSKAWKHIMDSPHVKEQEGGLFLAGLEVGVDYAFDDKITKLTDSINLAHSGVSKLQNQMDEITARLKFVCEYVIGQSQISATKKSEEKLEELAKISVKPKVVTQAAPHKIWDRLSQAMKEKITTKCGENLPKFQEILEKTRDVKAAVKIYKESN